MCKQGASWLNQASLQDHASLTSITFGGKSRYIESYFRNEILLQDNYDSKLGTPVYHVGEVVKCFKSPLDITVSQVNLGYPGSAMAALEVTLPAVTLSTDTTDANIAVLDVGVSGAIIAGAFLNRCQSMLSLTLHEQLLNIRELRTARELDFSGTQLNFLDVIAIGQLIQQSRELRKLTFGGRELNGIAISECTGENFAVGDVVEFRSQHGWGHCTECTVTKRDEDGQLGAQLSLKYPPAVVDISMTEANLSGLALGPSGAILPAGLLSKCRSCSFTMHSPYPLTHMANIRSALSVLNLSGNNITFEREEPALWPTLHSEENKWKRFVTSIVLLAEALKNNK